MATSLSSFPSPTWSSNSRGSHQLARTRFLGFRELRFLLPDHMLCSNIRKQQGIMCALGGSSNEDLSGQAVFPKINERDPYKRLGIPRDASEEEIRAAWSYLISLYGGHEKSRASIEAAYDKILFESLRSRRQPKFNVQNALKKQYAKLPPWMRNLPNTYDVPSSKAILIRSAVFGALAIWSALDRTLGGPAFQVVLSLFCCIYFLNDRLKSKWKALLAGFILSWVLGSMIFLFIPAGLYPKPWSTEVVTALISYVLLWFSCTFFKNPPPQFA
ncbi:hypothetical protein KP509_31G023100 [Ceratopteris richardii]|uniref:Protein CHAPERONE-LIKE PROTEIN OF POR1, chloroplastic n=1 Tax=Ceratopteris richardii TaxID=49495 RepID=A0A8T2QXL4_CERRI|nr:hypothetical protein KP509_31G023100 [Ceratopteris richardii]